MEFLCEITADQGHTKAVSDGQDHFNPLASHTCTVVSYEPEAMRLPSGNHATLSIQSVCNACKPL
jgi:hypothetical protein